MADNNVVLNVGANTGGFSSALTKAIEEMSKELNTSLEKGFGDVGKKLGESLIDAVKQASADAQPELLKIVERLQTETNKITAQKEKQADAAKRELAAQENIARLQAALAQQRAEGQSSRTINKTESYISASKDELFKAQSELSALNTEIKSSEQIIASLGSQIASSSGIDSYKSYMEAKLELDRKAYEQELEHQRNLQQIRATDFQTQMSTSIAIAQHQKELDIERAQELQDIKAEEKEANADLIKDYIRIREAMSQMDVLSESSGKGTIEERLNILNALKDKVNEITNTNISGMSEETSTLSMLQSGYGAVERSQDEINRIRKESTSLNDYINKQITQMQSMLASITKEEQKQADIEAKRAQQAELEAKRSQQTAADAKNKASLDEARRVINQLSELNKQEGIINTKHVDTLARNITRALNPLRAIFTDLSEPMKKEFSKLEEQAKSTITSAKAHNASFRAAEEARINEVNAKEREEAERTAEEIRRVRAAEDEQIAAFQERRAAANQEQILRSTQNFTRQVRQTLATGTADQIEEVYARLSSKIQGLTQQESVASDKYNQAILKRQTLIERSLCIERSLKNQIRAAEDASDLERAEALREELRQKQLTYATELDSINETIKLRERDLEYASKALRSAQDEYDTMTNRAAEEEERIRKNYEAQVAAERKLAEEKKKQRAKDQSAILNSIKYIYQQSVTNINNSFNIIKSNLNEAKRLYSGLMNTLGLSELNTNLSGIVSGSLDNASALVESQSLLNQIYSDGAEDLLNWADSQAYAYGIASKSAREYISQISSMLMNLNIDNEELVQSMTKSYTKLAGDLASAFNASSENVYAAIRSAVAGISRPLLRYGINTKIENLEDWVQKHKIKDSDGDLINYRTLSEANKQLVRYAYIMEQTRKIHGDYSETFASFANNVKTLKNEWQNFLDLVGKYAIPIFKPVVEWLLTAIEYAKEFVRVFADIMGLQVYDYAHSGVQIVNDMAESQEDFSDAVDDTNKNLKKGTKLLDLYELDFGDSNKKNSADLADEKELAELLQGLAEDYGDFAPDFEFDIDTKAVEKFARLVKRTLETVRTLFDTAWNFQIGDISLRSLFEDAAKRLVEDPIGLGIDVFGTIYSVKNIGASWNSLKEHLALVAQAGGRENLTKDQRIVAGFKGVGIAISGLISAGIGGYDWGNVIFDLINGNEVHSTQVLSGVTNSLSGILATAIGGFEVGGPTGAIVGGIIGILFTAVSSAFSYAAADAEATREALRKPVETFFVGLNNALSTGDISFKELFKIELAGISLTKDEEAAISDSAAKINGHVNDVKNNLLAADKAVKNVTLTDSLEIDADTAKNISDAADSLKSFLYLSGDYNNTAIHNTLLSLSGDLDLTERQALDLYGALEKVNTQIADETAETYKNLKTLEASGKITDEQRTTLQMIEREYSKVDFSDALNASTFDEFVVELDKQASQTEKTLMKSLDSLTFTAKLYETGVSSISEDTYSGALSEIDLLNRRLESIESSKADILSRALEYYNVELSSAEYDARSLQGAISGFNELKKDMDDANKAAEELRESGSLKGLTLVDSVFEEYVKQDTKYIDKYADMLDFYVSRLSAIDNEYSKTNFDSDEYKQLRKHYSDIDDRALDSYLQTLTQAAVKSRKSNGFKLLYGLSSEEKYYWLLKTMQEYAANNPIEVQLKLLSDSTFFLENQGIADVTTKEQRDDFISWVKKFYPSADISWDDEYNGVYIKYKATAALDFEHFDPSYAIKGKAQTAMRVAVTKWYDSYTSSQLDKRRSELTEDELAELAKSFEEEAPNAISGYSAELANTGYLFADGIFYGFDQKTGTLVEASNKIIAETITRSSGYADIGKSVGEKMGNSASSSMQSELLSGLPATRKEIENYYVENPVQLKGKVAVDLDELMFITMTFKGEYSSVMKDIESIRNYVNQNPLEIALEIAKSDSELATGAYYRQNPYGTADYVQSSPLDVNVYIGNREINDYIVDTVEQANRERG